jgi:hypothetical protein
MRSVILGAIFVGAVMVVVGAMASGTGGAEAHGNSPAKLGNAGWTCFPVEGLGVHCVPPSKDLGGGAASIPVLIFDTNDPGATQAPFNGTEILIHDHLYRGQPCPQEGLDEYVDLSGEGLPYFACHRYDTSP